MRLAGEQHRRRQLRYGGVEGAGAFVGGRRTVVDGQSVRVVVVAGVLMLMLMLEAAVAVVAAALEGVRHSD